MTYDPNGDRRGPGGRAWAWLVGIVIAAVLIIIGGSMLTNKASRTAFNTSPAVSGSTGPSTSTHTGRTGAPGGGGSGSPATGSGGASR